MRGSIATTAPVRPASPSYAAFCAAGSSVSRTAPPLMPRSGEQLLHAVDEEAVVRAGEHGVLGALDAGGAVDDRVEAGRRRVERAVGVLAQEPQLVVGGDRRRDRGATRAGSDRARGCTPRAACGCCPPGLRMSAAAKNCRYVRLTSSASRSAPITAARRRMDRITGAPPGWARPRGCTVSASGRRAVSLIRMSRPIAIQLATSDEPPWERNGVVSPVSGISRLTPPTTTNTCSASTIERPAASSVPNASRQATAVRRPRWTTIA